MINYRKILVMGLDGISQRTISSSTGHSRNTVAEVLQRANQKGIKNLEEAMNNEWLETYLFPEKQAVEKGYCPVDFEWVHKELQKKNSLSCITNMQAFPEKGEKSPMHIVPSLKSMGNMRRSTN
ncbi:hypothetical protein [Bacillus infantis]|uniref:hypothetical protein n=1 Tax=Bacillus infantis TaxID=324767 RepID=UPI003CE794A2